MKETFKFNNVKVEIIFSRDHYEEGNVRARSIGRKRPMVEWKCNICDKKYRALHTNQEKARMKAYNCAESHFDDTKKYYEG